MTIFDDNPIWTAEQIEQINRTSKVWYPPHFIRWFVPRRPPTEEDKAIHRAISQNDGDGKRYGFQQYRGEE